MRQRSLQSQTLLHSETEKIKIDWKFQSIFLPCRRKGEIHFSEISSLNTEWLTYFITTGKHFKILFLCILFPVQLSLFHLHLLHFEIRIWDKKVPVTFLKVTSAETQKKNVWDKREGFSPTLLLTYRKNVASQE